MDEDLQWQPAVFLPLERMCGFHRRLWELHATPQMNEFRNQLVGHLYMVTVAKSVHHLNFPITVPAGECLPLSVKLEDGSVAGCFSCEISTD